MEEGASRGRTLNANYYDVRPVYSYLQSHLGQYVDTTSSTVVLPIFEFIFKNGGSFAQTTEDSIGSFAGISLGDLAIAVSNDMNLFDNGYELSRDTIHELGHSMGLMHPHSFGQTEDSVASAMAYAPYEYSFSQFDVDAVQRAHADQLLSVLQGAFEFEATTMQTGTTLRGQWSRSLPSAELWIGIFLRLQASPGPRATQPPTPTPTLPAPSVL